MKPGVLAFWLRIAGLFLLRSRRTTVVLSLPVEQAGEEFELLVSEE